LIEISNLTKRYGRTSNQPYALNEVSLSVNDKEIVGFVGLNGAGKTTTIRIASGVILPSSGTVSIDGYDIGKNKSKASEQIGWVPEFPNFELNAKAKNLLLYFAGFRGIKGDEASRRASELFRDLELSGQENKKLQAYSQGMKKRFSLGLALLPDPKNFLFDEILNGLDPQGIQFVRRLLQDLRGQGKSILLSSHILSEIEAVSDRIVFIHKGRLIKSVTNSELSAIEQGSGVLRMTIPNLDEKGQEYLRTLGEVTVDDKQSITLSGFTVDPSAISAELMKRGFLLREFSLEKSDLEEYFFKLVGESKMESKKAM
jgi:ABC-2 type transport system ATP-binding protein